MRKNLPIAKLLQELELIKDLDILLKDVDLERYSKDFYNYSPILEKQLANCLADLVVRPNSLKAILSVSAICYKHNIPLTLRGSGTGNYGQCVPLNGGIVMLMGSFRSIRSFNSSTGQVTVEPGCLLRDLDAYLLNKGRQLRLLPSTWRSASVGGFVSGGSGGIGSVRWGFLRDPGHLIGLEVVTVEENPRLLELNDKDAEALNHAYGTNGIITSLTLSTAPSIEWQEVIIDCSSWEKAVDLLQCISCAAIELFLCSLIERDIVENLPICTPDLNVQHRLLILASPDSIGTIERIANSFSTSFNHLGSEDLKSGKGLRELTWNHTTLHMRTQDSSWTYLQMLLPDKKAIQGINSLKRKWGKDLLWHLEAVRQQGSQRLAALPVVKWRGVDSLEELIHDCKEIGAVIFNPHVITVEEGGLGIPDTDQVDKKKLFDPKGLLNQGKLKGYS